LNAAAAASAAPLTEHMAHAAKLTETAKSRTKKAIGWSIIGVAVNSCDQTEKAAWDGATGSMTESWNAWTEAGKTKERPLEREALVSTPPKRSAVSAIQPPYVVARKGAPEARGDEDLAGHGDGVDDFTHLDAGALDRDCLARCTHKSGGFASGIETATCGNIVVGGDDELALCRGHCE